MTDTDLMTRKCSAHSKQTGEPCGAYAIPGGTVCKWHGGKAPQTVQKARERILAAADPAAAELVRLALEGSTEQVRVQATKDLLDRAGLAGVQKIEVTTDAAEMLQRAEALEAMAAKQKVAQN